MRGLSGCPVPALAVPRAQASRTSGSVLLNAEAAREKTRQEFGRVCYLSLYVWGWGLYCRPAAVRR